MIQLLFTCVLFLLPTLAIAHGNSHKKNEGKEDQASQNTAEEPDNQKQQILDDINESYLSDVRPIFQEKCFNCHSSKTNYPWYYAIPGPRQLIDHDIEEAMEHLDLSNDFPFKGHGSPREDLEELVEVIDEDSMPPWQYLLMHWGHSLSDDEKKKIQTWAKSSLASLPKEN